MDNNVLFILLVPIALIFIATAYNFSYLVALIGVLKHIDQQNVFSYILRLAMLQSDAAGQFVLPSGKEEHALVAARFAKGLGMTLLAIATMVGAILLIWYGESAGWWVLNKSPAE